MKNACHKGSSSYNNRRELAKELYACLSPVFHDVTKKEVRKGVDAAFAAYEAHMLAVRRQGEEAVAWARAHGKRIIFFIFTSPFPPAPQ